MIVYVEKQISIISKQYVCLNALFMSLIGNKNNKEYIYI